MTLVDDLKICRLFALLLLVINRALIGGLCHAYPSLGVGQRRTSIAAAATATAAASVAAYNTRRILNLRANVPQRIAAKSLASINKYTPGWAITRVLHFRMALSSCLPPPLIPCSQPLLLISLPFYEANF